jgi:hypothetical protein
MTGQVDERKETKESRGKYKESLESKIWEELEKDMPWNVIAKKLHTSSKTISRVKSAHLSQKISAGEAEVTAKVFQLFETGIDPVNVTIELKESPELVLKLYDIWMKMKERSNKLNEIYNKEYNEGYDDAMKIDHFHVPCTECGEPILFTSNDEDWERAVKPALLSQFKLWHHTKCKKPYVMNLGPLSD